MSRLEDHDIDVHRIIAKTIYFGMFTNVLAPMALLLVCFYFDKYQMVSNKVGDMTDVIFYVLAVLSLGHAAFGFWSRHNAMRRPLIHSLETMEDDLAFGLVRALRPAFFVVAAISIYGYLFFYLTGRFQETVFIVLFSFLVFQVIRPRYGALRKMIAHQVDLIEKKGGSSA